MKFASTEMATNLIVLLPCDQMPARAAYFISSVSLFLLFRAAILKYVATYSSYVRTPSHCPHTGAVVVCLDPQPKHSYDSIQCWRFGTIALHSGVCEVQQDTVRAH
jgi:hypothetical protein